MNESYEYFKKTFQVEHGRPSDYSPLALAYIGDSIFDVMIRTMEVSRSNRQVNKYHNDVSKIVCASSQAKMMRAIKDRLTEEEHAIYKRGRNANFNTKAKNSSMTDYRNATAFEAVLGYLYLKEDFERLTDVVKMALDVLEDNTFDTNSGVNESTTVNDRDNSLNMDNESNTIDNLKNNDKNNSLNKMDYEEDGSGD